MMVGSKGFLQGGNNNRNNIISTDIAIPKAITACGLSLIFSMSLASLNLTSPAAMNGDIPDERLRLGIT